MSDRRPLRSPPTAVPIFRIVSLLVMLAVIGLTIDNLYQRAHRLSSAKGDGGGCRQDAFRQRDAFATTSSVPFRCCGCQEEPKAGP